MMESSLYTVTEGEVVEVCVAVERGQLETMVQFSIFSHPASAQEEDYNSIFRSVSLSPGESRVCFHVETVEDGTVEREESFHLILSSWNPAVNISTQNMTFITIGDNDGMLLHVKYAHTDTHTHTYTHTSGSLNCVIWQTFILNIYILQQLTLDWSLLLTLPLRVVQLKCVW